MGLSKRDKLVNEIYELGFSNSGGKTVAVTLGDFFDGNEDEGSLACNLDPHPSPEALYYHLQRFANENGVDIYVEIQEVDEDDDEIWPYSERVYLIGAVDMALIAELQDCVLATGIEEIGDIEINGEMFEDVTALWWD